MTELATTDDTEISILPPARPMASEAIGQLMAHADAMAAAKQLGDALADTDMVPKDYKGKPGNAAAAILYGAELGLNPIQSLQQIFVIHGSPAIYARTAVALVMKQGIKVETISSTNDAVTVRATDPHTDRTEECTWDIARAELAGYTSNAKYQTNPQEMLYAKAAMECCRKIAPDVLLGIPYAREELELEQPRYVPSQRAPQRARGVSALREAAAAAQPTEPEPQPEPSAPAKKPFTFTKTARKKWQDRMFVLFGDVTDRLEQIAIQKHITGRDDIEHRDELTDEELRDVVNMLNDWDKGGTFGINVRHILGLPEPEPEAAEDNPSVQESNS